MVESKMVVCYFFICDLACFVWELSFFEFTTVWNICVYSIISLSLQKQAERIKRQKAQTRRGDDAGPQGQPDSLVAVNRFHGSRLASGPSPVPYQQSGSGRGNPQKVARLSSEASTVGAAIVEAENILEDVCFIYIFSTNWFVTDANVNSLLY